MSTSKDTMAYILEQLEPLPTRARSMFGEYALYFEDKVMGFVCDDTIFLKQSPASAGLALGPAYPGSKDYAIVDADLLEDSESLRALVRATADSLPAPKPKPKPKRA